MRGVDQETPSGSAANHGDEEHDRHPATRWASHAAPGAGILCPCRVRSRPSRQAGIIRNGGKGCRDRTGFLGPSDHTGHGRRPGALPVRDRYRGREDGHLARVGNLPAPAARGTGVAAPYRWSRLRGYRDHQTLAFGGQDVRDVSAPVLGHANLGALGMVGLDSLRDKQVVLDFVAHRFTFAFYAMDAVRSNPNTIVVDGHRRRSQLVLVDADSHSRPIFVILDSGAQATIGNEALRRLVTRDPAEKHRLLPGELLSVTGSRIPAMFDNITEIRVGGIAVENVPIAFADIHTFKDFDVAEVPAMLLGMDVLSHFQSVSIDFRQGEAMFLPR